MTRDLLVLILQKLGFGRTQPPQPPALPPAPAKKPQPYYQRLNTGPRHSRQGRRP